VVPLGDLAGPNATVHLRMTRGNWRVDWVALAVLGGQVEPVRLRPQLVKRGDTVDDAALRLLLDADLPLVTRPGDEFVLRYSLPGDFGSYELFLESRGYYLEWMRDEWLAEEDPDGVAMMFLSPDRALRVLAPEFKRVEPGIEEIFWSSRYAGD